jgi:5-formyltetrahydrofolate cyclo-ligase
VPIESIDVMLVPGLAFDAAGRRLGFGGGYYDAAGRALRERRPASLLVGFAYDFQIVDACPADARDVAVDVVVTERRVLTARADA